MRLQAASVDDHLATAPAVAVPLLRKLRSLAHKAAPGAEERISYGMPAIFVDGRVLLYFAAFKKHVGVYPPPVGDAAFMKAIAPYAGPKGNLSFPLDTKIPDALLRAIIAARLAAVRQEGPKKAAKKTTATNTTASKPSSATRKSPRIPVGNNPREAAAKQDREGAEGAFARRTRWPMPAFVKRALKESGLTEAYRERPAYQRNDYVGWIIHAKTPATRMKRLAQMLDELERGGVYMRMKHAASARPRT
jgi:uncharacterized protein YdhG (YjbR/CyaY superfamily)